MLEPMFLMLAALVVAMLGVIAVVLGLGDPFRRYHAWVNLPVFGRIARLARLPMPTLEEANRRLDRLFRGYRTWIADAFAPGAFERARQYLFLAGDSDTRPAPAHTKAGLAIFLAAEACSFAFLLGARFNADATENQVVLIAALIVAVLVLLLAIFGHVIGGIIRRTKILRKAAPHRLDASQAVPGEKPMVDLTTRISLDEPQDRDKPLRLAIDSQRVVNRVASYEGDRGSYLWPTIYAAGIMLLAYLQFELRMVSDIASTTLSVTFEAGLPAATVSAADEGALIANLTFVGIFLATQLYAVRTGYVHRFIGVDSARAYRMLKGADTQADLDAAFDDKVRTADESLTSLLTKYRRFRHLDPDTALFLERVARERAAARAFDDEGGDPPAQDQAETNVRPFPVGEGGK